MDQLMMTVGQQHSNSFVAKLTRYIFEGHHWKAEYVMDTFKLFSKQRSWEVPTK